MHPSPRRAARRRIALGLSASLLVSAGVLSGAGAALAEDVTMPADPTMSEPGARVTLGVLPDTQFYSRYATPETGNQYMAMYGSEPYASQTAWLAEHAERYGIAMSMHLGDIVDQQSHPQQWAVADAAMRTLEDAGHPYSILAGNHDVGAGASDTDPVAYDSYLEHFPAERAESGSTFRGRDASGAHEYHVVEADGQQLLVMSLSWQATDASLDWASAVLDAHPTLPTIVTSHQLINVDGDGTTPIPTDFGERVWDRVIANHDQVFLTFNGHHHGATRWERTNAFGNPVHQVLMDHQMAYMGGNGIMGLVELDLTHGKIHQTSFSPWVLEKPAETLVADDQALLTGAGQSFTLDFDFAARFPALMPGAADDASPTAALREHLLAAYDAPEQPQPLLPSGPGDYPQVDSAVAHWTMPTDAVDGEIAPVGSVVRDIVGGDDFTRAPLNEGPVTGAEESDVSWSSDHHPLSANAGSVCFADASRVGNVASYFLTDADAAINAETFSAGFTLETFVKIDPAYSTTDNAWMQWLTRDGQRGDVPGYANSEREEPPFAWAFSNLSEVQFSFVDAQQPPVESSNWSGEIVNLGEWIHLAAVNDPATAMTTLFVDGVPVLRNAPGTLGIGHDGAAPWVLGAGSYAGERQSGFLGCIGETRFAAEPLAADRWLTARADAVETPAPTEPAPSEPAPSEPAPSEPAPSEPAPSEPAPSEPAPSESAASGSGPSAPGSLPVTGAGVPWPLFAVIAALLASGALLLLRTRTRQG